MRCLALYSYEVFKCRDVNMKKCCSYLMQVLQCCDISAFHLKPSWTQLFSIFSFIPSGSLWLSLPGLAILQFLPSSKSWLWWLSKQKLAFFWRELTWGVLSGQMQNKSHLQTVCMWHIILCCVFQIKLVNIHATDIADGRPSIVLGLIWTVILYFQVILHLIPESLITVFTQCCYE